MWRRYSYGWVTLMLFAITFSGHWVAAWYSYVSEQLQDGKPIIVSDYVTITARDTLENLQSEFLQLLWQVGGLAILLYAGSPQSKDEHDRMEAKLDAILAELRAGKI
jgi:hypothetical protein